VYGHKIDRSGSILRCYVLREVELFCFLPKSPRGFFRVEKAQRLLAAVLELTRRISYLRFGHGHDRDLRLSGCPERNRPITAHCSSSISSGCGNPKDTPARATHGYRLPDDAHLPQPPLVGVLPREGELPVRESVEVVFGVVDELLSQPCSLKPVSSS
jgi:hypothetical protein